MANFEKKRDRKDAVSHIFRKNVIVRMQNNDDSAEKHEQI